MNERYKALTRSYRPQSFEDIVSQEHVSNTLMNAIRGNRLSHAYMFCGPRGVGKTTMARVLARAVNEVGAEVDGEALGGTLNIVEMDAASNRRIEDIRSLKEVIRVPPQNGKYKIFIIDEVHMLTTEAFNALLKTLEEPPPHAIFIFATTEPHKVLPTILSRVQRFDFKRISVAEIVDRLREIAQKESIRVDEESLHVIAKRADGALRDALGLMDQAIAYCGDHIEYKMLPEALNIVDAEHLFEFTGAVRAKDSGKGLLLIDELMRSGTDIQEFLAGLTEHLRNLYVACGSGRLHLVEATDETKARYREQAANFSEEDLLRMLHLVSETQLKMKDARQPRVHFEILILKLIHMSRAQDLNSLLGELKEVKKKFSDGSSPSSSSAAGSRRVNGAGPVDNSSADGRSEPIADNARRELAGIGGAAGEANEPARVASVRSRSEETEAEPAEMPGKVDPDGIKTLGDVIEKWDLFLQKLEKTVPRILYFQMQRCRPGELKGSELTLILDNEFAGKLIDENRQELAKTFNREFGARLMFRCRIQRNPDEENNRKSPYERFMELQKKDPNIRALVELFGAELEY